LNNPTRALARGIAEPAPQLLLPLEANANYGWIRLSGEVGYWITGKNVSNSWIQGIVAGREFRQDTELYLELCMISTTSEWPREFKRSRKPLSA
jgi:hypothetical protein